MSGLSSAGYSVSHFGAHVVCEQAGGRITLRRQALDQDTPSAGIRLQLQPQPARKVWLPHIAPAEGNVVGDHVFRSPAVILSSDTGVLTLIPDLDDLAALQIAGRRAWLDYDHQAGVVTFAVGNYAVEDHVFFRDLDILPRGGPLKLTIHVLESDRSEDVVNPFGPAAHFLWQRWGRPLHLAGEGQTASFSTYLEYISAFAFNGPWASRVWHRVEIDGVTCEGPTLIVGAEQHPSTPPEHRRWREAPALWNQAWFSTQRVANGLLRLARSTDRSDLADRAQAATRVALAAPRAQGLYPSVFSTAEPDVVTPFIPEAEAQTWSEAHWTNSNRRPWEASASAVHIVDAATTARLLLEWDAIAGEPRAVGVATDLADRLLTLQDTHGAFPGWVEPNGAVVPALAAGPESAVSATLLMELWEREPERTDWRESAIRCLQYLADGPVHTAAWEDFETWYSCCRWGTPEQIGRPIPRNGVHKQNSLSIFWCAEAFFTAWRVLNEPSWLALARRCLDELSLSQQVWNPPFLPVPAHGGFGVMNADGEWNDARQGLFAPLFCAFGAATGELSYFERGVAAARAAFTMLYCPENAAVRRQYEDRFPGWGPESYGFMMENAAHGGSVSDHGGVLGPYPFTIFTWGPGTALWAATLLTERFGSAYVDVSRGWASGVDGCRAVLNGGVVIVMDHLSRGELTVKTSDGSAHQLRLTDGTGRLNLG